MTQLRISEAAALLAVSDDTVRRWIAAGELSAAADASGVQVVDGTELATRAKEHQRSIPDPSGIRGSARNRLTGLVTEIRSDPVMSQVELLCGPFRIVSLMSTEAVGDLGLEVGSVAVAVIKSTTVIVEVPR